MIYAPEIVTPIGVVSGFEMLDPEFGRALSLGVPVVNGAVQMGNFEGGLQKARLAVLREERSVLIYREDGEYPQARNLFWKGPEEEQLMFPHSVPFVRFVEVPGASYLEHASWVCADIKARSKAQGQAMQGFAALVGMGALTKQLKQQYGEALV